MSEHVCNGKCKNGCINVPPPQPKLTNDMSIHPCGCYWPECEKLGMCDPVAVTQVMGRILWSPEGCNSTKVDNMGQRVCDEMEKRGYSRRVLNWSGRLVSLWLKPDEVGLSDEQLIKKLNKDAADYIKRMRRNMTIHAVLFVTILLSLVVAGSVGIVYIMREAAKLLFGN